MFWGCVTFPMFHLCCFPPAAPRVFSLNKWREWRSTKNCVASQHQSSTDAWTVSVSCAYISPYTYTPLHIYQPLHSQCEPASKSANPYVPHQGPYQVYQVPYQVEVPHQGWVDSSLSARSCSILASTLNQLVGDLVSHIHTTLYHICIQYAQKVHC